MLIKIIGSNSGISEYHNPDSTEVSGCKTYRGKIEHADSEGDGAESQNGMNNSELSLPIIPLPKKKSTPDPHFSSAKSILLSRLSTGSEISDIDNQENEGSSGCHISNHTLSNLTSFHQARQITCDEKTTRTPETKIKLHPPAYKQPEELAHSLKKHTLSTTPGISTMDPVSEKHSLGDVISAGKKAIHIPVSPKLFKTRQTVQVQLAEQNAKSLEEIKADFQVNYDNQG